MNIADLQTGDRVSYYAGKRKRKQTATVQGHDLLNEVVIVRKKKLSGEIKNNDILEKLASGRKEAKAESIVDPHGGRDKAEWAQVRSGDEVHFNGEGKITAGPPETEADRQRHALAFGSAKLIIVENQTAEENCIRLQSDGPTPGGTCEGQSKISEEKQMVCVDGAAKPKRHDLWPNAPSGIRHSPQTWARRKTPKRRK